MTLEDFTKMIAANAKTQRWLSGHYDVEGMRVGVKAFGLWVQRIEVCGLCDSIPEQRTQKALREAVADAIATMRRSLALTPGEVQL